MPAFYYVDAEKSRTHIPNIRSARCLAARTRFLSTTGNSGHALP